jgi:hypothetical protein
MNDRNVEALEVILDELSGEAICERELMIGTLARALAARGVLTRAPMPTSSRGCSTTSGGTRTSPATTTSTRGRYAGSRADVRKRVGIRDVADSERGRRAAQDVAETDHLAPRREP